MSKADKKRLYGLGIILALFIPSLACGSGLVVNTPSDAAVSQSTATPELGAARSNPAPPGSEVVADDMRFVVTGITRPATSIVMAGNAFNTRPEEGQEYVFVGISVTCEKSTDVECSLLTLSLKLVGSKGIEYDFKWFVSGVDGLLEDTQFFGGATISGNIPFIIDADETDLILVYEPFLFGDKFYLALPE